MVKTKLGGVKWHLVRVTIAMLLLAFSVIVLIAGSIIVTPYDIIIKLLWYGFAGMLGMYWPILFRKVADVITGDWISPKI